MSTIGGIFRRDDAPLDPERMDRLCQALRRRGPDGGRTSVEGPVAMAHRTSGAATQDYLAAAAQIALPPQAIAGRLQTGVAPR